MEGGADGIGEDVRKEGGFGLNSWRDEEAERIIIINK